LKTTISVIIADDHKMMLEGLAQALGSIPDIEVVDTANDGHALLASLEKRRPDVLLVDVEMPGLGGIAALATLEHPPPTLIVTMHTDEEYRRRAAKAGAVGFLSKASPLPDLAAAIRAADAGIDLMDVDDLETALAPYRQPRLTAGEAALTDREREILALLAQGVSRTEDLADELYISQKTVKNHLASIYEKLGVSDRAQLVVEAMRLGLHR
jgi:two-component system, NarL family, response regulator DegU